MKKILIENISTIRTQAVEDQTNDRLRFKQNQYAQRSLDRVQTRRSNDEKSAELPVCILPKKDISKQTV